MTIHNVKIVEFGNGLVEVRKYAKPVNAHLMYVSQEECMKRQQCGKEERERNDMVEYSEIEYNPFTEKEERIWDICYEDVVERRKLESQRRSRNRTINAIYNLSRQCMWEYFITLTYSPEVVDRYDFDTCMKKANTWFKNQQQRKANDLQYLFVPEQHKDGAWHIHGLLAQVGNMSFVDSGHCANEKIVYNMDGWRYGFSTAVKIGDDADEVQKVSTYITKYITKELCENTLGKKRYYRSRNIPEPVTTELLIENDDNFINVLADSLGKEVFYEKSVKGYVDIDYKYLK